ncbi:ATP-binding protein [Lichenifustis flavocetrariae]|uniref:ATP-binding protein n=1 Tax=Lichenifustis flavocetrariae TaxID=2949735 RepID=UPI00403FF28C
MSIALGAVVSRRSDIAFGWVFWCFVTFILACGATHFISIVTLWWPIYGVEAMVKVITAIASVATAIILWPLVPRILNLPSPQLLRLANESLTLRIAERDRALQALEQVTNERAKTEEMLRQAQKMEAIGQLTGGIAHDFNNLLNVVVANLERIERLLPDQSPLLRPVKDAMAGADRAAALTHKLLAFARNQPLRPVRVEVNALLGALTELLRGAVGGRIVVETNFSLDLWAVTVDPNQLENAVLNLAVNARDAMEENQSSRLQITTSNIDRSDAIHIGGLRADQDYVMIEVIDTGVGMPEEVARRAFEPFFTTKPLGQGTGLGLSQVFGFVKQSGGHADIFSKAGLGTRVQLFLPSLGPERPQPVSYEVQDMPGHPRSQGALTAR